LEQSRAHPIDLLSSMLMPYSYFKLSVWAEAMTRCTTEI
jgi:hypothetical protein